MDYDVHRVVNHIGIRKFEFVQRLNSLNNLFFESKIKLKGPFTYLGNFRVN